MLQRDGMPEWCGWIVTTADPIARSLSTPLQPTSLISASEESGLIKKEKGERSSVGKFSAVDPIFWLRNVRNSKSGSIWFIFSRTAALRLQWTPKSNTGPEEEGKPAHFLPYVGNRSPYSEAEPLFPPWHKPYRLGLGQSKNFEKRQQAWKWTWLQRPESFSEKSSIRNGYLASTGFFMHSKRKQP